MRRTLTRNGGPGISWTSGMSSHSSSASSCLYSTLPAIRHKHPSIKIDVAAGAHPDAAQDDDGSSHRESHLIYERVSSLLPPRASERRRTQLVLLAPSLRTARALGRTATARCALGPRLAVSKATAGPKHASASRSPARPFGTLIARPSLLRGWPLGRAAHLFELTCPFWTGYAKPSI